MYRQAVVAVKLHVHVSTRLRHAHREAKEGAPQPTLKLKA